MARPSPHRPVNLACRFSTNERTPSAQSSLAKMRLLMAGLMDWELRSIGPVRARIRRKRLDAVEFFRRIHGPLADDRLWMTADRESHRHRRRQPHEARSERAKGVLWHHF